MGLVYIVLCFYFMMFVYEGVVVVGGWGCVIFESSWIVFY